MEKKLTEEQVTTILKNAPKGTDPNKIVEGLLSRGYVLQGLNDTQPTEKKSDVLGTAKAAIGGIASGVGGAALTAEDYLGRKAVNALPTAEEHPSFSSVLPSQSTKEQMQTNLANAPSLNEQFKTQMGGNEHPTAFGIGQLGGEVAALAAPVGAVGTLAKTGAKAIGAGSKVATLTKAGAEGAAFTAGQGLTENKAQSLSDYAINTGLNIALPGAGMVAKGIGENLPGRIINSLIKPLQKDFAYGKNPGDTVAKLGITGNTMEDLVANIKNARQEAGNTIGQVISQAKSPLQLSMEDTLKALDEAISAANRTPRTNATLLSRLDSVKADIVDNLNTTGGTMQSAQEIKGLIGDLTKWTGAHSDDAVVNKALQKTYTSVRDQMDNGLKNELTPEQFAAYKEASDNYGNLMSAENATIHRDAITSRNDLISFGAKNSALLAGIGSAIATGGGSVPVILAGLAGAGIDKAMASPAFKTRLAQLLSKLAPKEVGTFFDKVPTAKSLFSEQELKNYIGEFKDVKANRGMINFSEWIPDLKAQVKSAESALSVGEKVVVAEDLGSTLSKMGINVGPITKNNVDDVIERAKKAISDERIIAKKEAMSTPAVKNMEARFKQNPTTGKLEGSNKVNSLEQEAKKYKSAEEFYQAKKTQEYAMSHRPTEGVRAFDLTEKVDGEQMIPKDMYEQWYGSRGTQADKESIAVLKKIKGNPEADVTIYRASPKESFNNGDWVSLSKSYAQEHAEGNNTKVYSKVVKAKDLKWAMDDVNEFGYYPENYKKQLTDIWNKANKK